MKNSFNLNRSNASKPFAYFMIGAIIIAVIVSLFSCGTDNPVNNNGGNPPTTETLIFSMAEFKLETDSQFVTKDTLINFAIVDTDSLKANFTLSTNCDTTEGPYANFSFGLSGTNFNSMADLNRTHVMYASSNDSFHVGLFAGMYRPSAVRYVKFSNISVYKIHN